MYHPEEGSYCSWSKNIMHDWEIIKSYPRATIEYCKRCGLKTHFYKANNPLYLKTHKRDFLQPTGSTAKLHAKEYGE